MDLQSAPHSLGISSLWPYLELTMKRVRYVNGALDAVEAAILKTLAENARLPVKDLAGQIGLSAPSTAERVRRLEEAGVIEGYSLHQHSGSGPAGIGLHPSAADAGRIGAGGRAPTRDPGGDRMRPGDRRRTASAPKP